MKPQPMSDAEIDAIQRDYIKTYDPDGRGPIRFAQSIIAARDAQWAAMIGEPVAEVADVDLYADHAGPVEAMAFLPVGTFLYAIKETP